jgi:hypothetical protein
VNPRKHNLNGKTFGQWTVLRECTLVNNSRDAIWECKCTCGRVGIIKASPLVHGKSKQCNYCHKHRKKYYPPEVVPTRMWSQILKNARKRGIKIAISPREAYEKFKQQGCRCALTGLPLDFISYATDQKSNLPSLDRIDNSRGYEMDNIQWLHKDVNRMKNIHDQKYFIDLCTMVANQNKVDDE